MSLVRPDIRRITVKEGIFMISRLNDFVRLILFNLSKTQAVAHFFLEILYFILKYQSTSFAFVISPTPNTTAKSLIAGDVKCSSFYDRIVCKKPGSFINEKCFFIGFSTVKGRFNFFV